MYYNYESFPESSGISGYLVWLIIAFVLAIVGGILVYVLFLNKKGETKLSPFLKWLKEFLTFKKMLIEQILKILYLMSTIFCILASFAFIGQNFLSFLLILILGPILIRVLYEASLMLIMIWKNTSEINKKLK